MKKSLLFYKRIISVITSLIIFLIPAFPLFSVSAAQASFSLSGATADIGRLIDLEFSAVSDKPICAVKVTFTYDGSLLEFKNLVNNRKLRNSVNHKGNNITVVFVDNGIEASEGAVLFSLRFKTLASGNPSLSYTVYECVDYDENFFDVTSCTSEPITINSKQSSASAAKSKSDSSSALSSASPTAKPAKSSSQNGVNQEGEGAQSTESETDAPLSVTEENVNTRPPVRTLLAIIIFTAGSVAAVTGAFFIGRKFRKPSDEPEDKAERDE